MKIARQAKILEIIEHNDIETQEDLAQMLKAEGFNVTQATISRDIREMKLTKIATEGGKQKYSVINGSDTELSERLIRVFRDAVVRLDYSQNMIVIKTLNGMGMAVAVAVALFGTTSPAALATTVGVLTEVPVMLFLVKVANSTKGWFKND